MTPNELNIYIPNDLSLGIIQSQVINKGNYFFSKKYDAIIYYCNERNKEKLKGLKIENIRWYKSLFKSILKLPKGSHLYTRNIWEYSIMLLFVKILRKHYIIYDYRGLVSSEFSFNNGNKIKLLIIKFFERLPAKFANEIHTVSQKFKEFLMEQFNANINHIVPCLVDEVKSFEDPDIIEEIKFIYVGGMSKWQKIEEILVYFNNIQKKMDCSLTIITGNTDQIEPYICKYYKLKINVLSGDNKFVLNKLRDHHIGFLFRDELMFNQVASPVKYLEYITNGVIPIISDNIGDYSDLTKNLGIGFTDKDSLTREKIINKKKQLFHIQRGLNIFSWKYFDENKYLKLINKKN